jgi:hypothetical protein
MFTKSPLCTRIYLALMALMPAKCGECGHGYIVDHDHEIAPLFNCFRCFKGSHDCDRNKTLHETLSSLNTPTGFFGFVPNVTVLLIRLSRGNRDHITHLVQIRHRRLGISRQAAEMISQTWLYRMLCHQLIIMVLRIRCPLTLHRLHPKTYARNFWTGTAHMELVGRSRLKESAVLLFTNGSAISTGYPLRLEERGVRRARIMLSYILKSARLFLLAVHALRETVRIFTLVPQKRRRKVLKMTHHARLAPGAKICRGGCGIAIFGVYRNKSRYLAFTATNRDNLRFPR